MTEHEKPHEETAQALREGSMAEMEAAARLFALQDRLQAEKANPPHATSVPLKGTDRAALQEFAETVRAEGPKEPPSIS